MRQSKRAPVGANVAVYWGQSLLGNVYVDRPQRVRIGAGQDLDVDHERFAPPLCVAEVLDDGVVVYAPDGELAAEVGTTRSFRIDDLTVAITATPSDAPPAWTQPADWDAARVLAISTLFHAFFIVAAWVTPMPSSLHPLAMLKRMPRFDDQVYVRKAKAPPPKPAKLAGVSNSGRHRGPEGRFGLEDRPQHDAAPSKPGAPRVDASTRERDRRIAMSSGLLGALADAGGASAVSNVLGPNGLGAGINEALGGLRGTNHTTAGGAGGLGTRGHRSGGGGRSIGIGGIGIGDNNGRPGDANIDLGGGGRRTVSAPPSSVLILSNGLSRDEVGRVVRRNIARFKYCYERQINANPNLAGKVSVHFKIVPTGRVATARLQVDTVGGGVGPCVQRVMETLRFPKPRGGGVVVVTYPFLFEST